MTVNERVRLLRKELQQTQTEFAEKISLTQSHLTSIELGKRTVTDRTIKLISIEFGITEEWLRTGKEPKFIEISDQSKFMRAAAELSMEEDNFAIELLKAYWELNDNDRKVIRNFISKLKK